MNDRVKSIINNNDLLFFNTAFKSCIDRAAYTAFKSIPESRAKIIKQKLAECKSAIASPDIFETIVDCTFTGSDDDQTYMADGSSRVFTSVFIDEFLRASAALVAKKSSNTALIYERAIVYFCLVVAANYPEYELEHICPFDLDLKEADNGELYFEEIPHVVDSSWKCIAMMMITIDDELRATNGMVKYNETMFIKKMVEWAS